MVKNTLLAVITEATTEVERVQGHIQLIRELSNELAGYLHGLPEEIWRNRGAIRQPL